MNKAWLSCIGAAGIACLAAAAFGQSPPSNEPKPRDAGPAGQADSSGPPAANAVQSDAERIARLTRRIEDNEKRLADLKSGLLDPESEYAKAEADFKRLDADFEARTKELDRLVAAGRTSEADALRADAEALGKRRQLAKERFDLAIQERKTLQEQITALEEKLQQDRDALGKLLAPPAAATQPAGPSEVRSEPSAPTPRTEPVAQPPAAPDQAPVASTPAPPETAGQAPPSEPAPARPPVAAPPSKVLVRAQEEAEDKAAQADEAEQQARSVTARIAALTRSTELERKLLETARKKAENAHATVRTLSDQAQQRWSEGAPQSELRELWVQIAEARERYRVAQAEVEEKIDRVADLEAELRQLQAEQIATLQQAEAKRSAAEQARKRVERLESPLAPHNLLRWALERGPRVIGIIAGMIVLLWVARRGERHIVRLLVGRSDHGGPEERENRAKTLVSVFHSAATVAVFGGGSLMLLTELGVNIVPLMGGAAVIGLAVAFGAQNLIRDYFYGFMILLESQYAVNDVVRIGDISGLVERITLRVTMLRSLDGTVHFVPNGEITRVSNMTHGWSRALFDIEVAYKEDVDRVMETLMELAKELRRDPAYRGLILDMPEMLGVDNLGDSGVAIRFFLKTRPLKQWTVRRELLRRIKKRFDELGIEIPFPHRTVYHRHVGDTRPDIGEPQAD